MLADIHKALNAAEAFDGYGKETNQATNMINDLEHHVRAIGLVDAI